MRVVIAGASGLIGGHLTERLRARGDTVVRLVRRPPRGDDEAAWQPAEHRLDPAVVDGADAVVNLSGASIGRLPWTRGYRREIRASRVAATSTLVEAIHAVPTPPQVFVSASAAGFYGSRPGEILTEQSAAGTGFLSNVCAQWEWEARRAADVTRVVIARSGINIARGGVLDPLILLTRLGVSGPLAGGRQYWPWISVYDEAAALVHLIDSDLEGPVNLVGPHPSTANRLMTHLAYRLHRPFVVPAPGWAIEGLLADAGRDLLLSSQRLVAAKLLASGFQFEHTDVEQAIDAALAVS
ncbi:TIGR01777 family oxidoreductase [Okibacterium endophyticum]